jgi:hypothetical protein
VVMAHLAATRGFRKLHRLVGQGGSGRGGATEHGHKRRHSLSTSTAPSTSSYCWCCGRDAAVAGRSQPTPFCRTSNGRFKAATATGRHQHRHCQSSKGTCIHGATSSSCSGCHTACSRRSCAGCCADPRPSSSC